MSAHTPPPKPGEPMLELADDAEVIHWLNKYLGACARENRRLREAIAQKDREIESLRKTIRGFEIHNEMQKGPR